MKKPILESSFADNGEFNYWNLLHPDTGELLWSEEPEEEYSKNHRRIKSDNTSHSKATTGYLGNVNGAGCDPDVL